jgi:hypothetical protein
MAPIAATLLLPFTVVLEGNVVSRVAELAAEEPCARPPRCSALTDVQRGWREAGVCAGACHAARRMTISSGRHDAFQAARSEAPWPRSACLPPRAPPHGAPARRRRPAVPPGGQRCRGRAR